LTTHASQFRTRLVRPIRLRLKDMARIVCNILRLAGAYEESLNSPQAGVLT